jgi:mannan polymerase II complex ANP1 subunit
MQMAKRMSFSVVGLPHYVIWHLYEPSVDDLKHMMELESERKEHDEEQAQKKQKTEEQFRDTKAEWEVIDAAVREIAQEGKAGDLSSEQEPKGSEEGPAAKAEQEDR